MCWQKEALQFAVIIDGGSTGTCVDLYAWAHLILGFTFGVWALYFDFHKFNVI